MLRLGVALVDESPEVDLCDLPRAQPEVVRVLSARRRAMVVRLGRLGQLGYPLKVIFVEVVLSLCRWFHFGRGSEGVVLNRLLGPFGLLLPLGVERSGAGAELHGRGLFIGLADDLLILVLGGPVVETHTELLEQLALAVNLQALVGRVGCFGLRLLLLRSRLIVYH